MTERESDLEERQRKDKEKADAIKERQIRQEQGPPSNEDEEETPREEPQ
jgi:hypothetical protein